MVSIETVLDAFGEHIILTYTALAIGVVLGIFMGIVSMKSRILASTLIALANIVQAVPSFAIVALVVPLLGIGFKPAVIAILLRTLLPIVRNTYTGLSLQDKFVIEAAEGLGMTEWQILYKIRLPNALPAIIGGIKFSAILANSIAILTAIIGAGGLGKLVFEGLASFNTDKILAGAIPAILLAILIDITFTLLERKVVPPHLRG